MPNLEGDVEDAERTLNMTGTPLAWMTHMTKYEMTNKVALVTGGASGIGRSTALAFAAQGARVLVADCDAANGETCVATIRKLGGEALFVRTDVAAAAQVESTVSRTIEAYGRLDYAFNNAGIEGQAGSTVECTEDNWDRVIAINLKSVWLCMKAEIPHILKTGGAIVNCASIAGLVGFPNLPAYVASKHGIVGLTRAAALEYAQSIRINAVCPGVIQTPMIDRITNHDPKVRAGYAAAEPMGRLGNPDEIADAVLWLSSPSASFVTGVALAVDGGWVAQ